MIDMASVLSGVGGASLVQSLALMFARRWMGRIDDVERELKLVKETEMKQIDERLTAATASRKNMHERIAAIEQTMVDRNSCQAQHAGYVGQVAELARISERVAHTSERTTELFNRVLSAQSDVDRMIGRLETLERKAK
jgi:hypothetical protein